MHWDTENYYPVFDWLWTSGQLSEADILQLPTLHINNVVNLALPTSDPHLPHEAERVTACGINYFHIPVLWETPQPERLDSFFRLMRGLDSQRTWVHCAKNKRVSAFIYLYRRMVRNEPAHQALPALHAIWQPNEIWQRFIDDRLRAHAGP